MMPKSKVPALGYITPSKLLADNPDTKPAGTEEMPKPGMRAAAFPAVGTSIMDMLAMEMRATTGILTLSRSGPSGWMEMTGIISFRPEESAGALNASGRTFMSRIHDQEATIGEVNLFPCLISLIDFHCNI